MSTPDFIETERLLLRAWRDDDREPYARMLADPEFNRFMPGPCSRSEADTRFDRIQKRAETNGFGPWVVEIPRQERFIGCTGLTIPRVELPFSPCVEIGWHLLPDFWGHGYATESARASMQFGFEHLALEEIVSFTVPDNVKAGDRLQATTTCDLTHDVTCR